MSERFGYSRKDRREIRKKNQDKIAKDVYIKGKLEGFVRSDAYNANIFEQGANWFNEGMSLEDAPENIRNNTNFINGYNKASRLAFIEKLKNDDNMSNTRGRR